MECFAEFFESEDKIEPLFQALEKERLPLEQLEDEAISEAHLVLIRIMEKVDQHPELAFKAAELVLTSSPKSRYYRGHADTSSRPRALDRLR